MRLQFTTLEPDHDTQAFECDLARWALECGLYSPDTDKDLSAAHLGMLTSYLTPGAS